MYTEQEVSKLLNAEAQGKLPPEVQNELHLERARGNFPARPTTYPDHPADVAVESLLNGLSWNHAPQLSSGVNSAVERVGEAIHGIKNPATLGQLYDENKREEIEQENLGSERHRVLSTLGNLAGSLASGSAEVKGLGLLGRMASSAGQTALYSQGEHDKQNTLQGNPGTHASDLPGIATAGVVGAAIPPALEGVGKALGKVAPYVTDKLGINKGLEYLENKYKEIRKLKGSPDEVQEPKIDPTSHTELAKQGLYNDVLQKDPSAQAAISPVSNKPLVEDLKDHGAPDYAASILKDVSPQQAKEFQSYYKTLEESRPQKLKDIISKHIANVEGKTPEGVVNELRAAQREKTRPLFSSVFNEDNVPVDFWGHAMNAAKQRLAEIDAENAKAVEKGLPEPHYVDSALEAEIRSHPGTLEGEFPKKANITDLNNETNQDLINVRRTGDRLYEEGHNANLERAGAPIPVHPMKREMDKLLKSFSDAGVKINPDKLDPYTKEILFNFKGENPYARDLHHLTSEAKAEIRAAHGQGASATGVVRQAPRYLAPRAAESLDKEGNTFRGPDADLEKHVPGYGEALSEYRKYEDAERLFDDRGKILSRDPGYVQSRLTSPIAKDLAKQGVAKHLIDTLESKEQEEAGPNAVLRLLNTPTAKKNISQIVDNPEAFLKDLNDVQSEKEVGDKILSVDPYKDLKEADNASKVDKVASTLSHPIQSSAKYIAKKGVSVPREQQIQKLRQLFNRSMMGKLDLMDTPQRKIQRELAYRKYMPYIQQLLEKSGQIGAGSTIR